MNDRVCCVCGYKERHGVLTGQCGLLSFVCLRCFYSPYSFFPCRRLVAACLQIKKVSRKKARAQNDLGQRLLSYNFS
jgi:hypothetical protein